LLGAGSPACLTFDDPAELVKVAKDEPWDVSVRNGRLAEFLSARAKNSREMVGGEANWKAALVVGARRLTDAKLDIRQVDKCVDLRARRRHEREIATDWRPLRIGRNHGLDPSVSERGSNQTTKPGVPSTVRARRRSPRR